MFTTVASSAQTFQDTLALSGIESTFDTNMAAILNKNVVGVSIVYQDKLRRQGRELSILLTYDSAGAVVLTDPFQLKTFLGTTLAEVKAAADAFAALNPGWFYAAPFVKKLSEVISATEPYTLFLFYCQDPNGAKNWGITAGATPTGGPGGVGTEIQYRIDNTTFGGLPGSSIVAGGGIQITGSFSAGLGAASNTISTRSSASDDAKLEADGGGGWARFTQSGSSYSCGLRAGGTGWRVAAGSLNGGTTLFSTNGTSLATGKATVFYTTASTSTTTGSLVVNGGLGVADNSYIAGAILGTKAIHASNGINNGSDAGVHIDRPNQNSAATTGGIVLTQQNDFNRRLYLTGNDGGFCFSIGSYNSTSGMLQFSNGQVAVGADFRIGVAGNRLMRNTDTKVSMSIKANSSPAALVGDADVAGIDTYFRTQSGGAHVAANPRGGDYIFNLGSGGAGGTGRNGMLSIQGASYFLGTKQDGFTRVTAGVVIQRDIHNALKFVTNTGQTATLPASTVAMIGESYSIRNSSGGNCTVAAGAGTTIEGAASLVMADGESICVKYDNNASDWTIF